MIFRPVILSILVSCIIFAHLSLGHPLPTIQAHSVEHSSRVLEKLRTKWKAVKQYIKPTTTPGPMDFDRDKFALKKPQRPADEVNHSTNTDPTAQHAALHAAVPGTNPSSSQPGPSQPFQPFTGKPLRYEDVHPSQEPSSSQPSPSQPFQQFTGKPLRYEDVHPSQGSDQTGKKKKKWKTFRQ